MILKTRNIAALVSLSLASFLMSCSKAEEVKDEETTTSTTNPDGSKKLEAVESVADLNLAGSFAINLPDALDGGSTSLRLQGAKRSQEACQIGQSIKEVTRDLQMIGSFFCHLEVEADKIKFGTKYKISFAGEEFARIWVDNSGAAEGKIAVYMCEDGSLKEKIDITGVNDNGAKGSISTKGTEGAHTWASNVTFDANFTTAGSVTMEAKQKFTDSENDGAFKRHVLLNLIETGISEAVLASGGSWQGSDFSQRGKAMMGAEVGNALFYNKGSQGEQTYEWTHRSYFDDDGLVVDKTLYDAFLPEGDLYIAETDLPEFLGADFAPDAPAGWDCEVEEEIELNPESTDHAACEKDRDDNTHVDCWGEDFEQGQDHDEQEDPAVQ